MTSLGFTDRERANWFHSAQGVPRFRWAPNGGTVPAPESVESLDRAEEMWGKGSSAAIVFAHSVGFNRYIRNQRHKAWTQLPSTYPIRGPYLCRTHADCKAHPGVAYACWERVREKRLAKASLQSTSSATR